MSQVDDWGTLRRLAETRSRMYVSDAGLRKFLEDALLPCHRGSYLRLLDVERMARGGEPRPREPVLPPHDSSSLLGRWQQACETLQELEELHPDRAEFAAAIRSDERCRSDAFVWRLLDRGWPDLAESVVLARLEAEGNPEGSKRNDYTTDLLAICRAQSANAERVAGDACGAFEKLRRATRMLRPGGDPYVSGKVLSYFASACIALGKVEEAEEALDRAFANFSRNGLVSEAGEILINRAHNLLLQGRDPRILLEDFLQKQGDNQRIRRRIISLAQLDLAGVLLYLHDGDRAVELLSTLPHFQPGSVEDLWKRHFSAIVALRNGSPQAAALHFADIAQQFFAANNPSQGFFVLLFEALSLLELGKHSEARDRAARAATYFSSTRFYGGVARATARRILAALDSESLNRDAIESLIKKVLSPASKSTGRAPDTPPISR